MISYGRGLPAILIAFTTVCLVSCYFFAVPLSIFLAVPYKPQAGPIDKFDCSQYMKDVTGFPILSTYFNAITIISLGNYPHASSEKPHTVQSHCRPWYVAAMRDLVRVCRDSLKLLAEKIRYRVKLFAEHRQWHVSVLVGFLGLQSFQHFFARGCFFCVMISRKEI